MSIDPRNLRFGNYFYRFSAPGNCRVKMPTTIPMKIITLKWDHAETLMFDIDPWAVEKWNKNKYSDMIGMPLTEKVFIDLGLGKHENPNGSEYYQLPEIPYKIFSPDKHGRCVIRSGIDPQYNPEIKTIWAVHELQNFYHTLRGMELKLDENRSNASHPQQTSR